MLGKMSRSSLARVVLPDEEQPLRPMMMAFWESMVVDVRLVMGG